MKAKFDRFEFTTKNKKTYLIAVYKDKNGKEYKYTFTEIKRSKK